MDDVVAALRPLGTSTISDALDRLGLIGQLPKVYPVLQGMRTAGRVFSIQYEPVDASGGTVGDYIDDVPSEDVLVLDNAARTDVTVWGDILTSVAHARGIQGTVINGVCRDTDRIHELGYPVFSVGRWMRTGKDRVRMSAVNVPLTFGDIRVLPGDIAIGDDDGVVFVPAARENEVVEAALRIAEAEDTIRGVVAGGVRLDEARSKAGYHRLQSLQTR
ncbi:RraA family protein [Rugosimonospora africana]|uniref:Putative 4-hydroxy-4-methyl-2-oxoglutarate aldolase n=1 Tax=Rugosimonospora africana TaxID=556532 RepID=A0A8J3QWG1_9ACTN|nr:RraA family protein [Rugosimonospora africana]GIH17806.1 diguanylate cyclase [Rugosimonospora africana]